MLQKSAPGQAALLEMPGCIIKVPVFLLALVVADSVLELVLPVAVGP